MCRTHAAAEMAGGVNVQGRELLPANVIPRHYHVTLEPDLKKLTFDGTVVIDLDVAEESTSISLHTLELDIHSASITSGGQTVRYVCSSLRCARVIVCSVWLTRVKLVPLRCVR